MIFSLESFPLYGNAATLFLITYEIIVKLTLVLVAVEPLLHSVGVIL